MVLCWNC